MSLLYTAALVVSLLQVGAASPPAEADRGADLADQYSFIFRGTVKKSNASNVAAVKVSDRTFVVTVDRVLQPLDKAGQRYAGKEVTVELTDKAQVQEGKSGMFYTNPVISGESLAVRGIAEFNPEHDTRAVAATEKKPDTDLKRQIGKADAVVVGKVVEIRDPPARATMTSNPEKVRISEHAADWKEAVIEVTSVEKGEPGKKKQVLVVFPQSQDVMWRTAPKYSAGQEGTWLLHKEQTPNLQVAHVVGVEAGQDNDAYTALTPLDFQPKDQTERVKALVKEESQQEQ